MGVTGGMSRRHNLSQRRAGDVRFRSLMLGLAVAGTGWQPPAEAGSTPVSVTVAVLSSGNCTFQGAAIGISTTIDAAAPSATLPNGYVFFKCVGGGPGNVSYSIANNAGQNGSSSVSLALKHTVSATQTIPYAISYTGSASVPKGNITYTTTLAATIQPSAYQNAVPGTYTDSVIFTIDP